MLEEKQSDVCKTSQPCSGVSGPQKSILDFFKSPGKGNSNNKLQNGGADYLEKTPTLSVDKPFASKSGKQISRERITGKNGDCNDASPSQQDGLSNNSARKRKKHKKSRNTDIDCEELLVEVVCGDTSSELLESGLNPPVSHLPKQKKSRAETSPLDAEEPFCTNGHADKSGCTENESIESPDRDSCTVTDDISITHGECLDVSKYSKHKHKKTKHHRSYKKSTDEVSKEGESVAMDMAVNKEIDEVAINEERDDLAVNKEIDNMVINSQSDEMAIDVNSVAKDEEVDNECNISNESKYKEIKHKKIKSLDHNETNIENEKSKEMVNVQESVLDVSSSSIKKHKKKKLRTKEDNINVEDKPFSEMELVATVANTNGLDETIHLNKDKEHRKIKKAKRKKSDCGVFQDKDCGNKNGYSGEKNKKDGRETVTVDTDSKEKVINVLDESDSKGITCLEQEEIHKSPNHLKCKEKFKKARKSSTKRKLEFYSESDKGCQSNKKKKKKKDTENSVCEDANPKAEKVVTMSYHDYLKTLVSTAESCNGSEETSSPSNIPEPGSKAELNDNGCSTKQDAVEELTANRENTDNTDSKSCDKKTPTIMKFFTKGSKRKSSEESVTMVVKVDVHDVPMESPVKQSSEKKELPSEEKEISRISRLLACSSPCVKVINDEIEFSGSEIVNENSSRKRKMGKISNGPIKQVRYKNLKNKVVKKSCVVKKYKKIKKNSNLKKRVILKQLVNKKTDANVGIAGKKTDSNVGTAGKKTDSNIGTAGKKTDSNVGTAGKKTDSNVGTAGKKTDLNVGTAGKKTDSNVRIAGKKSDLNIETAGKKIDSNVGTAVHKLNQKVKSIENGRHSSVNSDSIVLQAETENVEVVSKTEDPAAKIKRDVFLKSTDTVMFPAKTAQAKLCFTQSGLLADKSSVAKTNHNTRVRRASVKSKKLIKAKTVSTNKKQSDVADKTEGKQSRITKKKERSKSLVDKTVIDVEEIETPVRRPFRTKYRVSGFEFNDSKETPIKMKISYCKSGSEENDFTPKSLKSTKIKKLEVRLAKAQELLHKAKKQKHKRKMAAKTKKTKKKKKHSRERFEEVVSNDESERRRSQRLAAQTHSSLEESVIEIDEEEVVVETKTKIPKSKSSLKPAASPRKKKTKPPGKLAPIFMKGGKTEDCANVSKPSEDPEKTRLRRAFLMSGIPEELKKQTASQAVVVYPESAPLPTVSHVQQRADSSNSTVDVWRLPALNLHLRRLGSITHLHLNWSCLGWKTLVGRDSKHVFENFVGHQEIPDLVVVKLIEELKVFNRNYPFAALFKELRTKRLENINSRSVDDQKNLSCQEVVNDAVADDDVCTKRKRKKKRKSHSDGGEAGEENSKRKGKLRLCKKAKDDGLKSEPTVSSGTDVTKNRDKDLMWTDCYKPIHSSEVIGHSKNIARMKSWLLEWKHRTALEERKLKKRLLQQTKGKSSTKDKDPDIWLSDNSDFDVYSESSDSEADDRLCNTLLITGRTGIGKTATVYAIARELSYKVIEVNASTSRNGKRILSQLQEATQSHQVAQSKEGITPNLTGMQSNTAHAFQNPQEKPVSKLPTAFTNLFQKVAAKKTSPVEIIDVDAKDINQSKSKKLKKVGREGAVDKSKGSRRVRGVGAQGEGSPKKGKKDHTRHLLSSKIHDDSSQTGTLNLSSTTLILFDEVDVFCEDLDKGFLPAVQHFMDTAKIPIILTTTDSNFSQHLHTRYEQIAFKPPSLPDIVSHLQMLCLVDNLRTDSHNLLNLVRFYSGDIRRCILTLQVWAESGGDLTSELRPLPTGVDTDNCTGQEAGFDESESEFGTVNHRTKSKSRRVIHDDDGSSCNPFPVALAESHGKDVPSVHKIRVEILLGAETSDVGLQDSLERYLQGSEVDSLYNAKQNLKLADINLLYDNILHFLPLPKTTINDSVIAPPKVPAVRKKFKRITSDIFDNEESLDGVKELEEEEKNCDPKLGHMNKDEKILNLKLLDEFFKFYDTMSAMDTLEAVGTKSDLDNPVIADSSRGNLCCGMDISGVQHEHSQWSSHSLSSELQSEVQLRSAKTFCHSVDCSVKEYKRDSGLHFVPEFVHLPVQNGVTQFRIQKNGSPREPSGVRQARENVVATLPLLSYCQPQVVAMDYLPVLRTITKVEQLRRVAKAKRRFHHYFDHIGFSLKESTLNVFQSTF